MNRRTIPILAALMFVATSMAQALSFPSLSSLFTPLYNLFHPIHVATEYDHTAQFGRRTYSWGEVKLGDSSYAATVRAAVDKTMQSRGWQKEQSGGSATVFALGDMHGIGQVQDFYQKQNGGWTRDWGANGLGPGWKPDYGEATVNALGTAESHFVVDLFDSSSHHLIFRGVSQEDISDKREKNIKYINRALKQLVKQVPKK